MLVAAGVGNDAEGNKSGAFQVVAGCRGYRRDMQSPVYLV